MNKPSIKSVSSIAGWVVGGVGLFVLFVLGVKWGWNSFFAGVLGFHLMDWGQALALAFWIVLVAGIYIGGREAGK